MHRNLNHHFNNGNAQRRPDPPQFRTNLRRYVVEKWLSTIIGTIGLLAGIFIIVQNEARAVQIVKSLEESISLAIRVELEAEVDESDVGKLVYMSGPMTVHEPLTEVDYGISVLAVKLFRNVQMYQWIETESAVNDGDGYVTTRYHYHTDWYSSLIDSSIFHTSMGHWNPKEFPIKPRTQINENVRMGKYHLGLELKKKFTNFVPITSDERPERQDVKLHSGLYYHSQNIWNPEVGDVRVEFSYAGQHGEIVTIVAKLDSSLNLVPYTTKSGLNILLLRLGKYSLEEMFAIEHSQNKFLTWVYRGAGWLILYLSCVCLTTYLQIIVSRSPFLQEILPVSHSSLKMTVSMCLSLMVTAFAWVLYRPILGIGLIIVTIFLLFITKMLSVGLPQRQYNRL